MMCLYLAAAEQTSTGSAVVILIVLAVLGRGLKGMIK